MEAKTSIALVSVPVYSHLRSMLEFSKRLVQLQQDLHVTCIIPTIGSPSNKIKALLEAFPPNIDYMLLTPIKWEDIPQETHPAVLVRVIMHHSLPSVFDALKKLCCSSRLVAIVSDALISQVLQFSKELNILSYIFFPSTAMFLSLCLYPSEYKGLYVEIPGCMPIRGTDLPDPLQDRSSEACAEFLEGNKRFYFANGALINSFPDMEAGTIRALQNEGGKKKIPLVYAFGPLVTDGSLDHGVSSGMECLAWLDKQQDNSVLYVSFGSNGTISHDQMNELALGLELSGQKFLWVMRPPSEFGMIAEFGATNEDTLQYLPNGFVERTQGQGMVVPYWAPQMKILGHGAIGGFLCHCGWNSTLESVVHGVPIMAWPLFAEQKMNAAMLTDGLRVALRPKLNEKGIVEKEEVAEVIKNLMVGEEGKGTRQRMKELKAAAADAIKEDGSSTRTLTELAQKWKSLGLA